MDKNNSKRYKRSTGLYQEAGSKQAVPVSTSEVHHGGEPDDRHEDVVEDDEWTVGQELLDLPGGDGELVLVQSIVHQVHWYDIIEEVGDSEYQIVVKNIESVIGDVSGTLLIDKHSDGAGAHCKRTRRDLVTDVMDSIARYLVIVTVFLSNLAGSQEHLADEADAGEEDESHEELKTSCQDPRPIVGWVEHLGRH